MRTEKIKNKLNDEIEALAPPKKVVKKEKTVMSKLSKGKKLSVIAASLVLVVALSVGGVFLAKGKGGKVTQAESYVALDINPSVEFILDKKNKVASISAGNDDGEVIMYALSKDGIDLVGKSIEKASEEVLKMSIKYNYVESGVSELNVTVVGTGSNKKVETTVGELVEKGINKAKAGIELTVNKSADYLLAHELEKLKAENPDNADYQALTAGKLRLIKSIRLNDRTVSMDEAVKLGVDELAKLEKTNQDKAKDKINSACELIMMGAKFAMDNAVGVWYDMAYMDVILETEGILGILNDRIGKATAYVAVNPVIRSIEQTEQLVNAYNANPIFSKDDLLNILAACGVENVDAKYETLKEDMKKYTDMSLQNIQKYIKELSLELKKVAEGTEEYRNIEAKLQFAVIANDEIVEDGEKVISVSSNQTIDAIQEMLTKIAGKMDGLTIPQTAEELEAMTIAGFHKIVENARLLREKMFTDMNLSDAEKTAAEQIIADRKADVDGAMKTFTDAIAKAKTDARAAMDKILATRINIDLQ